MQPSGTSRASTPNPSTQTLLANKGTIRLRLELQQGVDPIAGSISDVDGEAVHFSGWIALAGLLEDARTRKEQ